MLVPDNVKVPDPTFVRAPVPEIVPLKVTDKLLKVRVEEPVVVKLSILYPTAVSVPDVVVPPELASPPK